MIEQTLTVSPGVVAGLLLRLCLPRLTPIAKAAKRHERALRRVFLHAVREAREAVPMGELERALSIPGTGGPLYVLDDVINMMLEPTPREIVLYPYFKRVAAGAAPTVVSVLGEALVAGAKAGATWAKLPISFDVTNPEAVIFAEQQAAALVKYVTEDVRDAIRLYVTRGFEEGIPPRKLAVYIRDGIGLTPRDAGAVLNRRAKLLAEGVSRDVVEKRAAAYSEKLLRRRALTIARTETMRASNEGTAQLWQQAKDAGLLSGKEKKVWLVADPCPICAPFDGEEVGMNEEFSAGTDPPLHPNCRCTVGLVP